ncbi:MAG: hypothetical protein IPF39_06255 [Comamonadaceae bacterium]|nr:hypothetical protein [Comamonadaceae bacterium]
MCTGRWVSRHPACKWAWPMRRPSTVARSMAARFTVRAYVQSAPVYVQPAPVYAAPAPVYYRPRVVAPVVYRPVVRPYAYGYRHHQHGPRPVPYYAPGAYGVGPAATVGYGP